MVNGNDYNGDYDDEYLDDFDEEEESDKPDYYYCNACGTDRAKKQPYNECPNCGAHMEEMYY